MRSNGLLLPQDAARAMLASNDPPSVDRLETLLSAVDRAIGRLASRDRKIFVRHLEGADVDAIAQEMAVPRGHVLMRIRQAEARFIRIRDAERGPGLISEQPGTGRCAGFSLKRLLRAIARRLR